MGLVGILHKSNLFAKKCDHKCQLFGNSENVIKFRTGSSFQVGQEQIKNRENICLNRLFEDAKKNRYAPYMHSCINQVSCNKLQTRCNIHRCSYIIPTSLFYQVNDHCFKFATSHKKCPQACPPKQSKLNNFVNFDIFFRQTFRD